ncbi:MAG: hypothetical protein JNL11_13160 [Bdellovibrionaceae bacterium]|nr:hypothetical protein [Pseudobdellovibrionaceae bacterium]
MTQFFVRTVTVVSLALAFSSQVFAQKKTGKSAPAKPAVATTAPVQQTFHADFDYELQTMLTGGGLESMKRGTETTTIIGAEAAVTKVIKSNIQVGAEAKFYNESGGGGSSYFQVLGIGVYNFNSNLKESLYGKVGLGMLNVVNDKLKNESKFGFLVGGGKRIPIMDKVAYTPEVRVIVIDGGTRFQIQALNFSIFY